MAMRPNFFPTSSRKIHQSAELILKKISRQLKVKNWKKFQHFKDRRPPWIKLYRDLIDDKDWHSLDARVCKTLVLIWLIASEDVDMEGKLPCLDKLAFRLRMPESELAKVIRELTEWLEQDDAKEISR